MFWLFKESSEAHASRVIEMLELKKAIEIANEHKSNIWTIRYIKKDQKYFVFKQWWFTKVYLDRNFQYLKKIRGWGVISIIDLSKQNIKIQEEFKDLFDWLKLQQMSYIKLKKFMKESMTQMFESQKWK